MRSEAAPRPHSLWLFGLLGCAVSSCSPVASSTSVVVTDWDCPLMECTTLESSATCTGGVCSNALSDANVVVAVRLPANSNASPGAFVLSAPSVLASCKECVSLPAPPYSTEQGLLVARELATKLGWDTGTDVVVPADIRIDALIAGRFPLSGALAAPLAITPLERWATSLASSPWRGPAGDAAVTSRAVVFQGSYARTLLPAPPFDEVLPPFHDTFLVPGGEPMHGVGTGTLATVLLPHVELGTRRAGWSLYLVDAKGERRSSVARGESFSGPVSLRVVAGADSNPLALDLVVAPGDEGVLSPHLLLPLPSALPRIAYPKLPSTARATFKVLLPDGSPASGASLRLRVDGTDPVSGDADSVFASYAKGMTDLRADAAGVATAVVPLGQLTAVARALDGPLLAATRELLLLFSKETASVTFRPEAPRSIDGVCAFAGGRMVAGATVEARLLDASASPGAFTRVAAVTTADGAFHLDLPGAGFAFWFRGPPGAPMQELLLGRDALDGTQLSQIPCRLRAPVRRSMTILDAAPQIGAPIGAAIVETLRLNGDAAPTWLGEGVSHSDGRVVVYEAPQ